jgi:hypothetical protein
MTTQDKRLLAIMATVGCILLLPLIGMQVSKEVNWSGFDFLIASVLLFGTAIAVETVLRKVKGTRQRLILVGGILFLLFLVWAELAVGLFGTPFAGS